VSEDKDEQGYDPKTESQSSDRTDTYRRKQIPRFQNCPSCPEIKKKIDRIYSALLGEDGICLTEGLVKEITDLKTKFISLDTTLKTQRRTNSAWLNWIRPIIGGVSVVAITELIIFVLTHRI
jgi:hypothetical protein